ncbi:2-octaprenyl-6-methoxyphenyl hydroxylase [Acidihalobacter yilgarnensis]|uniref:2-octaprenyl-6-methoxyphenyl hydroxylase n=1 Tax=Acidihalobacter yilgarnensis TaxID=2819280 RepID=A0A1D8IKE3_9GAMM|nr:2-octaprenyl-6-methoxyphenyl hydroxylase [Acidihalobacter yilgarnensis]AOU96904.1 2-octaprenyl-6-methoxyphenyl hydroxylase [Acidihalobacter yilgarnensis]
MNVDYDILIVGGGMVGASLGAALAGSGRRVGILEARPYGTPGQPSYDDRSTALALGSRHLLDRLGVWPALSAEAAPITHIHVSDRGHFGVAHIDAAEQGVRALGYVVPNRALGAALLPVLEQAAGVELIAPAEVADIEQDDDGVVVRLAGGVPFERLRARLVVAADGTGSPIREQVGIPVETRAYGQSALIANVSVTRLQAGVAYERFTDEGPLAMLPMGGDRYSLVWTHREADLPATLALGDAEFLAALQQRFGWRLGRLKAVGRRASYPLGLTRALETSYGRVVLVGNALHTLHPVAGQGFNLALRDVEALARALEGIDDPGEPAVLAQYRRLREGDMRTVVSLTDAMVRLFSGLSPLPGALRSLGLVAADCLPDLNRLLARQHMGLYGAIAPTRPPAFAEFRA